MRITERVPKNDRELEIFYRQTIEKLKGTETALSDEEQKSSIPFNGMIRSLTNRLESLGRENKILRSHIKLLESRISDIERQL